MTRCGWLWLFLAMIGLAQAEIGVGDSYQKVIAEKGKPTGTMQAGDTLLLRYPGLTVRLKSGKVVAIGTLAPASPSSMPRSEPSPARPVSTEDAADAKTTVELLWTTDYGAALKSAKEQNRRVLIYFSGSDWSTWCARMDQEILSTPEFAAYVKDRFVLLQLDQPKGKPISPGEKRELGRLGRFYGIQVLPTVVILDPTGQVLGQAGYVPGGPEAFIQRLPAF